MTEELAFFGITLEDVNLYEGSFIQGDFKSVILTSDIIFSNNYLFGDETNMRLRDISGCCKDNTQFLVSASLFPPKAINTKALNYKSGLFLRTDNQVLLQVDWTHKPVPFQKYTKVSLQVEEYISSNPGAPSLSEVRQDVEIHGHQSFEPNAMTNLPSGLSAKNIQNAKTKASLSCRCPVPGCSATFLNRRFNADRHFARAHLNDTGIEDILRLVHLQLLSIACS